MNCELCGESLERYEHYVITGILPALDGPRITMSVTVCDGCVVGFMRRFSAAHDEFDRH